MPHFYKLTGKVGLDSKPILGIILTKEWKEFPVKMGRLRKAMLNGMVDYKESDKTPSSNKAPKKVEKLLGCFIIIWTLLGL